VAVQEVNALDDWDDIVRILEPDWDYIATDESDRKNGGNGERLTYLFDKRKVRFQSIAGEIVLPADQLVTGNSDKGVQFARTPYVAMFQSGWFKFALCSVHIYFGAESGQKHKRRIKEIEGIAQYLKKRSDKNETIRSNCFSYQT